VTLDDFPAFTVEEISVGSDEMRVRGRFNHLTGVRLGPSALYCGDAQWPGDLIQCEPDSRRAVFTTPLWVQRDRLSVGSVVPWLPGGWQYFRVNMILAPTSNWQRRRFVPSDAQHFRLGDGHGWTKVGAELDAGEVPTHVEKRGWDHEECRICDAHIGRGMRRLPEGYVNPDDAWLCQACYERYARTSDLGFIFAT
jgi:hypothetical protein